MELKGGIATSLPYAGSSPTDSLAVKSGGALSRSKDDLAAKKVAREFESLFVGMMLKSMRETVGKDPITDGGHGEEVYRSMLDQEYSRVITEHGGIGLASMLEKQINISAQGNGQIPGATGQNQKNAIAMYGVTHENRK
jgi:peptidoglycan hydrolase FlgJ